jgi:hypothetical protein
MSRIEVILTEPAQTHAFNALAKPHSLFRSEFEGPVFADAKCKVNALGLEVLVDGVSYIYPAHSIARVKISEVAK